MRKPKKQGKVSWHMFDDKLPFLPAKGMETSEKRINFDLELTGNDK